MEPVGMKKGATARPLQQATRYIWFLWTSLRDPRLGGVAGAALGMIVIGTLFYRWQEKWAWLDAMYFSVITLATVGYGDLAPTTAFGKLFTMVYALLGVILIGAVVSVIVTLGLEHARQRQTSATPRGGTPAPATGGRHSTVDANGVAGEQSGGGQA